MEDIKPIASYREVTFRGHVYKRPGISPVRESLTRKGTALDSKEIGTDENPIMKDGIPYVYNSTGKLVKQLDFDPETMEMFILTPRYVLTNEQILMLKKVKEMPIVYDIDCPKSTPERLERFRKYGIARNKKMRAEPVFFHEGNTEG